MKHNVIYPVALFLLFILSACTAPMAKTTPSLEPAPSEFPPPRVTWWVSAPTPEPTPEYTPFPSYEDFFSQVVDYGSMFDEEEHDYGHFERIEADNPVIALVQEQITDDTLGLIPKTMKWVIDRCLYIFWAGNENGAYLYRLYSPTETLDLIYAIPAEEFEEKYFYTPQTEATVSILNVWGLDCQVGERVCLLVGVGARGNQFYEWATANPEFLALFDEIFAHKEDYPQYDWDGCSYDDLAFYVECDHAEEQLYLNIYRCVNSATGEYREKTSKIFSADQYEIQW